MKGGRNRSRETSIGCFLHAPKGDLAFSSGMCPDWESNWQPALNSLSHTSQGVKGFYIFKWLEGKNLKKNVLCHVKITWNTNKIYSWIKFYRDIAMLVHLHIVCPLFLHSSESWEVSTDTAFKSLRYLLCSLLQKNFTNSCFKIRIGCSLLRSIPEEHLTHTHRYKTKI